MTAAAFTAAAFVSLPAAAQRETLAERVARLEQQLGSGSSAGNADVNDTLGDLVVQLNELQAEIRELRGMIEEQGFEIESLRNAQRDQYLDLDRRIGQAGGAAPAASPGTEGGGFDRPVRTRPGLDRAQSGESTSDPALAETTTQPAPAATGGDFPEVRESVEADLETSGLGRRSSQAVTTIADPVAEKQAYDEAFDALKNGRYAESSRLFNEFVERYPASEYADNAQYWLGESYYVTRNYRIALDTFQRLISQFPDSAKVPDARLKIGLSYYSMQNWDAAQKELKQVVEQYPDTTVARLAQNRLRTMRIEGYIE